MALTKTAVSLLASQSVAAGAPSTKTAPTVTGASIDVRAYDGGDIGWSITNGSSAPGTQGQMTFQQSPDNAKWYEYYSVGGNITASGVESNTIYVEPGVCYLRAICYGNTTNAVTMEASFVGVVR